LPARFSVPFRGVAVKRGKEKEKFSMRLQKIVCSLVVAGVAFSPLLTRAQSPASPQDSIKAQFADIHRKLLAMAKDFPADKYTFRLKPEMRSFGEVIVHVTSGVVYAAKAGRGEKVKWDELNAKDYPNKTAAVALMERSINEATATLNSLPAANFSKTIEPWLSVLEHSGEHYGLLVAYYRANGIVPPESRPAAGK
jgi:DinB superfamily